MAEAPATSRIQPFTIEQLVRYAEAGQLRVPEFQRSFRWNSRDVVELFDSIRRGYPVGNALLWKRAAGRARVRLGDLSIDAPESQEALWVVDGQQRITSLVNAVHAGVEPTSTFAVCYLPAQDRFMRAKEVRGEIAIPVPDLFSIPRLLQWLQANPEAVEYAEILQSVTTILRDFSLPTSVVEGADETELRRIFDRINNAGKRLTAAEVFDAINRTPDGKGTSGSVGTISESLAATTSFGVLPRSLVYQALLVRRHPDISRSPHAEFESDRRASSDFPQENQSESFAGTESALRTTLQFLQQDVGVPHFTFLPQQFLLLTLTRFFAFFPEPMARTKHLLARWFWRAASRAPRLGFSGASSTVRSLAGLIRLEDEYGSVRRLLDSTKIEDASLSIDFGAFRTNQAASKIVLCTIWAHGPRSLRTGEVLTEDDLGVALGAADTPADVVAEVVRRRDLSDAVRLSAGNRMILGPDDLTFREWIEGGGDSGRDNVLESHLIQRELLLVDPFDADALVRSRQMTIAKAVETFIRLRTGEGMDDTPPLEMLDLDAVFDVDEASR